MQASSIGTPLALLVALGLAIAFAFWAAPLLAVPVFVVVFGGFLVCRGSKRRERWGGRGRQRVPSTQQASADPAHDSGLADVGDPHEARETTRTRA